MKSWVNFFFIFLFSFSLFSQNYDARWTGHFSYSNVKDITASGDDIYVAAENAIFHYNLITKKIETFTTVQGLSGESIATIYYNKEKNLIFAGYETGLINIISFENNKPKIRKVVDILEKQSISPDKKGINHFYEYNQHLYISTDYGVSVFNLDRLEFGDTYFIGDAGSQVEVVQSVVKDSYIYSATKNYGIRRALVNDRNIIDYRNWDLVVMGNFTAIDRLGNDVFAANTSNSVIRVNENGTTDHIQSYPNAILKFRMIDDLLTVTTKNSAWIYSPGFIRKDDIQFVENYQLDLQSATALGNNAFLGTAEDGLLIVPFGSTGATQILPNGPIRNRPFALDASPGQLWVVFGETTINFNPYPYSEYGVSQLRDSTWNNTSYRQLTEALNGKAVTDIMKVTINPNNPEEVYMSSFYSGLLKFKNGRPYVLYDDTNSPLERIQIGINDAGIRLFGSEFDKEGNLWFLQSRTAKGLIRLSPEGQFKKINLENFMDASSELALTKLAISREGNIFFGAYYNGLLGYNPTNNKINKIGENAGAGNLPSANVRALAVDAQNRLWIGTLRGLRLLHSPASFFEGGIRDSQAIIIMENGVAQELLYQQSITAIKVDGSNNKWIATASSGVFYLSSNGQETLLRFTKDNSPLPSNNVQDIAIDPESGVVYFATTQGLVSYKGTATAPQNSLAKLRAFPNPVRPEFKGLVTIDGLTAQANVKITDVTGNLVYETTSQGGSVQWDTTVFGRHKVRSGVYFIMVTTEDDQETKVAKVMIVR